MEQVIIISTEENKKKILRENSQLHHLFNLKFYTFNELKKKLFFDYDLNAITYIVKHYQVTIPVAKIYLENLYFLKDLEHEKVKFLVALKEDLESQHLLIYSPDFGNYFNHKKVIVYGYPFLTKKEKIILSKIQGDISFQNEDGEVYQPQIYEAGDMNEEVEFVLQEIAHLIEQGVDVSHIKLIASSSYDNLLNRYFSLFHLPFNHPNKHSYYSTQLASSFLACYDEYSIEENIMHLSEKYQNINDLISVINRSAMVLDKGLRKEFIIQDLKQTMIEEKKYEQAISTATLNESFSADDYVFILGFQVGEYPKIKKDIDYLPDRVKEQLGIDTSMDENQNQKQFIVNQIQHIKNLVITYHLNDLSGTSYPSMLIKEENFLVHEVTLHLDVSYSRLYSEIKYALALDYLRKFNMVSDYLAMYQNNLVIPYFQYDNQFTGIYEGKIKEKLNSQLMLSYTNLEMYQECAFKYYVSKILHLDIFLENFKTILGSIMHHILELGLLKDIDISVEIIQFVKEKEYQLSAKELFYLEEFSEELVKILEVIRQQQKHSKLMHYLFEQEFFVYKDNDDMKITFKGNIDKVMYENIDGKEYLAVVDYKTGNTNITLKNLDYGLNIQLPIYLYLLKKSERFKNAFIVGFYIQKILANKENIQFKKTEQELLEARLRLQGFTNRDEKLIRLIDDDYMEGKILQNLKFKRDGELSSQSKVLTNEEMDDLIVEVDEIIDGVIKNILKGEFYINPKVIDGKNVSCTYCKFRDLCYMKKQNEVKLGGEEHEMDGRATVSN